MAIALEIAVFGVLPGVKKPETIQLVALILGLFSSILISDFHFWIST